MSKEKSLVTTQAKLAPAAIYFCLLIALAGYGLWLVHFVAFDGFSTLANDSASYLLLARKWSMWHPATYAEVHSWPVNAYPPVFPWFLSLTGVSHSLYWSHVVVGVCLITAIGVFWLGIRGYLGSRYATLLAVICLALPGAIVNSMGILSENLYMLLSFLTLYSLDRMRRSRTFMSTYVFLFVTLLLASLTRTIGFSLLATSIIVAFADNQISAARRTGVVVVVALCIAAWLVWRWYDPQPGISYVESIMPVLRRTFLGEENGSVDLITVIGVNVHSIVGAFQSYMTLTQDRNTIAIIYTTFLAVAIGCLILRALRLRTDAIYLSIYLLVLLVWPYYLNERFLHPVVPLLLLQPIALIVSGCNTSRISKLQSLVSLLYLCILLNLVWTQWDMHAKWKELDERGSTLRYSSDVYRSLYDGKGEQLASRFFDLATSMTESGRLVPVYQRVASVKPEFYAILAGRAAVELNTIGGTEATLCRLRRNSVDKVFITDLVSGHSSMGMKALPGLRPYLTKMMILRKEAAITVLADLDSAMLDAYFDKTPNRCASIERRSNGVPRLLGN